MKIDIKNLIKKICTSDTRVITDHDLNITVLDPKLRTELKTAMMGLTFSEMNRVIGYFIEELEGDGINMEMDKMDDPDTYLAFCLNECDQTLEDVQAYVNEFKHNNLE